MIKRKFCRYGATGSTFVFPSLKDSESKPVCSRIFSVAFSALIGSLTRFGHRILYLRLGSTQKMNEAF